MNEKENSQLKSNQLTNSNQTSENKLNLDRERKFPIFTKLKDFYTSNNNSMSKNHIEEKIEPVYESMRIKYKNLYNSEPTFFIRVPYTQILFGDSITHLFDEQIITTLEKDLIICGGSNGNNEKELQIEFFDKYCDRFKHNIENNSSVDYKNGCTVSEHINFIISAFNSGIQNINLNTFTNKKILNGANLLFNFNISNIQKKESFVTTYVASFLASLYVNNGLGLFSEKAIFDMLVNEFYKLNFTQLTHNSKFSNFSTEIYFQLFLEKNSIGVYVNNEYKQFKIDPNYSLLICETFSPEPPLFYKIMNCHSKRKIEFRLGLAMILRRNKKSLSQKEIFEICSNFKTFVKYFENNLETIFELIGIYFKKTSYKISEIKSELDFDLNLYLSIEENSEYLNNIIESSGSFEIYKRLLFVFKEYERVLKISTIISALKDKEEAYAADYFKNNIMPMINESNNELDSLYDCLGEDITKMINFVKRSDSVDKLSVKLASDGWSGNILVLGEHSVVEATGEALIKDCESNENRGQEVANIWISDEINKYCYWSGVGGSLAILNPIYEDFMLL